MRSVCFIRNTGETQARSGIIILFELRLLRCEIDGVAGCSNRRNVSGWRRLQVKPRE